MTAQIESVVANLGLSNLVASVTRITITDAEPTTYALATTTGAAMIAYASLGAGNCFLTPSLSGSLWVTELAPITQASPGVNVSSGVASWRSAVDDVHGALYAHGSISPTSGIVLGVTPNFYLPNPIQISLPQY